VDITACAPPCRMRAGGQANTGGMPPLCGVGLNWDATGRRRDARQRGAGRLRLARTRRAYGRRPPEQRSLRRRGGGRRRKRGLRAVPEIRWPGLVGGLLLVLLIWD